jgi:hypothetical protein
MVVIHVGQCALSVSRNVVIKAREPKTVKVSGSCFLPPSYVQRSSGNEKRNASQPKNIVRDDETREHCKTNVFLSSNSIYLRNCLEFKSRILLLFFLDQSNMPVYNFKSMNPVPTASELIDIVLMRTQRRTPTVIHPGYKITRIRSF